MIDINKQIDYWKNGAVNDLETAELLISGKKHIEGLFFCHLTIEKILKSLFVKKTNQLAPKTHNLNFLYELTSVKVSEDDALFLSVLMRYQLEGRYPDFNPKVPSIETVNDYLCKTKTLFECLRQKL
jgi:HEPN domain-containing protein